MDDSGGKKEDVGVRGVDSSRMERDKRTPLLWNVGGGEYTYAAAQVVPERPQLFKQFDDLLSQSGVPAFDFGHDFHQVKFYHLVEGVTSRLRLGERRESCWCL